MTSVTFNARRVFVIFLLVPALIFIGLGNQLNALVSIFPWWRSALSDLPRRGILPEVAPNQRDNIAILTLFDKNYRDMFSCWLSWLTSSNGRMLDVNVVALDDMAEFHVRSLARDRPGVVRRFWLASAATTVVTFRSKENDAGGSRRLWPADDYQVIIWASILKVMQSTGKSVFHIDTDAFVYGNVMALLEMDEMRDADIIGACDCFGPGCDEWACSLNPGVMFFRNSDAVRKVAGDMLRIFEENKAPRDQHEKSDMFMLNRHLVDNGECDWKNTTQVWKSNCRGLNLRVVVFPDTVCRGSGCCEPGPWNVSQAEHVAACRRANVTIVHARNGYDRKMCETPPV